MPLLAWNDSYAVGVAEIDEQHKRLFDMINRAEAAAEGQGDAGVLSELIMDLNAYARSHFALEGRLMRDHDYPDSDAHLEQHAEFAKRTMPFQDSGLDNDALDPAGIFQYLADWLKHHILETDMELGRFLNEKGVD